jgi:hypothetical protein
VKKIFLLLGIVLTISCEKDSESSIIGEWSSYTRNDKGEQIYEFEDINNPDVHYYREMTFNADLTGFRKTIYIEEGSEMIRHFAYEIDSDSLTLYYGPELWNMIISYRYDLDRNDLSITSFAVHNVEFSGVHATAYYTRNRD